MCLRRVISASVPLSIPLLFPPLQSSRLRNQLSQGTTHHIISPLCTASAYTFVPDHANSIRLPARLFSTSQSAFTRYGPSPCLLRLPLLRLTHRAVQITSTHPNSSKCASPSSSPQLSASPSRSWMTVLPARGAVPERYTFGARRFVRVVPFGKT